MDLPMTFADFAATEAPFLKQFRKAPPETWNDDMVLLADFLALDKDEREGKFPYIWAVDAKNRLTRLLVTEDMVRASEERLNFWRQLRDLTRPSQVAGDTAGITDQLRAELMQKVAASLGLGDGNVAVTAADSGLVAPAGVAAANMDGYEPAWVETPECTACDECTNLAPKAFAYNGAKYADLVKAAEKCTAGCIHPGTPWNPNEAGLEKLIARGAKYN
jgi:pyruvate-ferredoxin/flavodoxin oxidoreductase